MAATNGAVGETTAIIHLAEPSCIAETLNMQEKLLLLDCRSFMEYNTSHIMGSINVGGNRMYRRRFISQKISMWHFVRLLSNISGDLARVPVIVYDQCSDDCSDLAPNSFLSNLLVKLSSEFSTVFLLKGGYIGFQAQYSNLCWVNASRVHGEDVVECHPGDCDLEKLLQLCLLDHPITNVDQRQQLTKVISTVSNVAQHQIEFPVSGYNSQWQAQYCTQSSSSSTGLPINKDSSQPSIILPYLVLGSQSHAQSVSVCRQYNITHVINVSVDGSPPPPGLLISPDRFLRIPLDDNYTDRMMSYFPEAFTFIDKVKSVGGCVLVHCSAGISRSPTLAIAYFMHLHGIPMREAYNRIKAIRPGIAPNFNFMGQLMEFERSVLASQILPNSLVTSSSSAYASICSVTTTTTSALPLLGSSSVHTAPAVKRPVFSMVPPVASMYPSRLKVGGRESATATKKRDRPTCLSLNSASSSSPSPSIQRGILADFSLLHSPLITRQGSHLMPDSDDSPTEGKRSRILSPTNFGSKEAPLPSPCTIFSRLDLSSPVNPEKTRLPVITLNRFGSPHFAHSTTATNSLNDLHFEPCSGFIQSSMTMTSLKQRAQTFTNSSCRLRRAKTATLGENATSVPRLKPILLAQRGLFSAPQLSTPTTPSVLHFNRTLSFE